MERTLAIPYALLLMVAVGCSYPPDDGFDEAVSPDGSDADSTQGDDSDGEDTDQGDGTELHEPLRDLTDAIHVPTDNEVDPDEGQPLLLSLDGDADVYDSTYDGVEDLSFTTDNGLGDDVCRISYKLRAGAPRHDCDVCEWAFDLVASDAQITSGTSETCADLGYDDAGIAQLLTQPRSYGFASEYYGHADVLLVFDPDDGWVVVSFATWSTIDSAFSYIWGVEYVTN